MFLSFNSTPTLIETTVKGCIIIIFKHLFVRTDVHASCVNVLTLLFRPRPLFPIG